MREAETEPKPPPITRRVSRGRRLSASLAAGLAVGLVAFGSTTPIPIDLFTRLVLCLCPAGMAGCIAYYMVEEVKTTGSMLVYVAMVTLLSCVAAALMALLEGPGDGH
jgi:peptidoglycan/LPS O-acetylase OafA/YrhL